jgi:diaminopimelate decarboxylase
MTLLDILPSLRKAAPGRFDHAIWPASATADDQGRRRTPAYVIDEADFRRRARRCRKALRGVEVLYAGTSPLTTSVARWAHEEGLGVDVRSAGELAAALTGGVKPSRIVMHGSANSPDELRGAVGVGVGRIVVDSFIEIAYLAGLARRRQQVLIRVTPGKSDPDFGFTLDGDPAADAVKRVLAHPILDLVGLHCPIGPHASQVTDPDRYAAAIHRMIAAMADIRARHGAILTEVNIGRGDAVPSVPYSPGDRELDLDRLARAIEDALDEACAAEHFPRPTVVVAPGRAISGRAGVALARVC